MTVLSEKQRVKEIALGHPHGRGSLIAILQEVQGAFGYISEDTLHAVAAMTGVSENEIFAVCTFYAQFRLTPPGEHEVRVCQGTACHVRGSGRILAELQQKLGVAAGETTADGKYELTRVACLGCCALAPTVTVDGEVHARMTAADVHSVLAKAEESDSK